MAFLVVEVEALAAVAVDLVANFDRAFYHNGADSYYSSRGFRVMFVL